jgi:hypothetical protein
MRMLLLLFSATLLHGVVIDRIAVIVDHQVITEAQLDEEIRVTAFLNGESVKRDRQTKRAAADRLIEQSLVRHEMSLSQYPLPDTEQVNTLFNETAKQFGGREGLDRDLAQYGLTEEILNEHLRFQLMMLKFVDFRFRPDVDVSESDIRKYYEQELVKWKQSHTTPAPALEESRSSIEKALSDQRVDYALSSWVEQARHEANIIYLDKELS